jgi:hypothetical protein
MKLTILSILTGLLLSSCASPQPDSFDLGFSAMMLKELTTTDKEDAE